MNRRPLLDRTAVARQGDVHRVLNCIPSQRQENDWTLDAAIQSGALPVAAEIPAWCDLRQSWWPVRDQGDTGACVGFATAEGVLRWHFTTAGVIPEGTALSPRFIWMANKETDTITDFPTTFIERAGTQTKQALDVARKYGCVAEADLPMSGALYNGEIQAFYVRAARLRIASYHNLGTDPAGWRRWLATQGPVLARLDVDQSFMNATATSGTLSVYDDATASTGHAITLVGYAPDHFIIRNSWGERWGDKGFAYAGLEYAARAFTEAYGVVLAPSPGDWASAPSLRPASASKRM